MSDQDAVTRKLAGFTPAADGIDRDEWLFRAGRASVRSVRGWKWACGTLAMTQAATLGLWATRPMTYDAVPLVVVRPAPSPHPLTPESVPEPAPESTPQTPDPSSYLALAREFNSTGALPPPRTASIDEQPAPSEMTAGSRPTMLD